MNTAANTRKASVHCVIVMGVLNLLLWWRLMTPEEIETLKGSSLELIIVLKSIYSLFQIFVFTLVESDAAKGMPSLIMAVGWLRGVGLAGSPVKTLSKRSPKPVDVGRLSCGDDIDEGPGVLEHAVSAGVAGISLAGAECLRMASASLS